MKTLCVFVFAAVVLFVATCRGDSYDKFRDVENDFQDRFTNKVNERRERTKSMFDPRCLTWTRRKTTGCGNGKRSLSARPIAYTCGPLLEIPSTHANFVELRENVMNILNRDNWEMDII